MIVKNLIRNVSVFIEMAAKFSVLSELDCPILAKDQLCGMPFVQIPSKTVVAAQYFRTKSNFLSNKSFSDRVFSDPKFIFTFIYLQTVHHF